jgi:hypothetical protein
MVVSLGPRPFDWQPGANNAKAAKAATETKLERQRTGILMGTSSATQQFATTGHSLPHRVPRRARLALFNQYSPRRAFHSQYILAQSLATDLVAGGHPARLEKAENAAISLVWRS